MVDNIVGTWTTNGKNVQGLAEYFKAAGKTVNPVEYHKPITVVITKNGNDVKVITTTEGKEPITDDVTIGKVTTVEHPVYGVIEINTYVEGNKLIFVQSTKDRKNVATLYIENNSLVFISEFGGASAIMRCTKA